ncbi:MAG: hypothetical protein MJA27_32935, partial [Pseudanabaenales cyanobacterium]|nr:hypothetical protein [Pseudanabaenales cyanobacterium]
VISFTDQPCLSPASPDHPDTLSPDDLGNLFMPDLHYLIERYNTINPPDYELSLVGESQAIPWKTFIRR